MPEDGLNRRDFLGSVALGAVLAGTQRAQAQAKRATNGDTMKEIDFIDQRWVEHTYFLTRKVTQPERFLEEPGFECLNVPELTVITFRYRPKKGDMEEFNRKLLAYIVKSKKLFLSSTLLHGKFVIRVCILSFRTHKAEVEEAFEIIKSAAKKLDKE